MVSRDALWKLVSVVFSDAFIFDGTIYSNILLGNHSVTEDEVIQAAKKAELHEFVIKLPGQYETYVGESGLNMSSGEKQKIALARVILKDTPIVIFDEFTRSIDNESKKAINSIIKNFENKIIIIITHNSEDIEENCNYIFLQKNVKMQISTSTFSTQTKIQSTELSLKPH